MIEITLDQYLTRISQHCEGLNFTGDWYQQVVTPWVQEIAPVKTVEYGIECWIRLGSKGLVVDISACFYRWLQLKRRESSGAGLENALVDLFGYSAMYSVCVALERNLNAFIYSNSNAFREYPPIMLNEWLIQHIWESQYNNRRVQNASRLVATQLAKSAWEAYHS